MGFSIKHYKSIRYIFISVALCFTPFSHALTCAEITSNQPVQTDTYNLTQDILWVENPKPNTPIEMATAINEDIVQQALENSHPEYLEALSFILDHIRSSHVSFSEFRRELEKSAIDFTKQNPRIAQSSKFVQYSPFYQLQRNRYRAKSNFWTFQLLMEHKQKLGLPNKTAVFKDPAPMLEYMRNNKIKDILITDDASYSGRQLKQSILDLIDEMSPLQGVTIHLVIPYMSSTAQNLFANIDFGLTPRRLRRLRQIQIYSKNTVLSLASMVKIAEATDQISPETSTRIKEIVNHTSKHLLYFDHKIPDPTSSSVSVYSAIEPYLLTDVGTPDRFDISLTVPNKKSVPIKYLFAEDRGAPYGNY